ncbi:MAG: T9SS type A sorting domain-containing protein [Muribaculaceae bacterium]|nr:T9SS type A sorting domain-containing protein [Muribaculaceae bacterium]
MKKIFTLMAASLLGAGGLMAMSGSPANYAGVKAVMGPEAQQKLRTMVARQAVTGALDENTITRSWQDTFGNTWDLTLSLEEEPVCEMLTFSDEKGNPVKYTFEELPYYTAVMSIAYFPANGDGSATRNVIYYLSWPTVYEYSQIFEAGTFDIPVADRDYSAVKPSVIANDSQYCHLFEQGQYGFAGDWDRENGTWVSWGIFPAENLGIQSLWNNEIGYSVDGTTIDFKSYNVEDGILGVDVKGQIRPEQGTVGRINIKYNGTARIQGFEEVTENLTMGDIHLYNAGIVSSEKLGEDRLFPLPFPELSALYIVMGQNGQLFPAQATTGGEFAADKVGVTYDETPTDEDFNFLKGYLFADPKYSKDPTLDPVEMAFIVENGKSEYDKDLEQYYTSIAPSVNTFVDYGYTAAWSQGFGLATVTGMRYYYPSHESRVAWGTTEGFVANMLNDYKTTVNIKSVAKEITYHYDEKDITKTRQITAVGSLSADYNPSAVQYVKADAMQAQIVARNGHINVVAGEKAPIAIFSLDGKLVKAANAQSVNVEAPKGVYVVRVGNQAKKVVL